MKPIKSFFNCLIIVPAFLIFPGCYYTMHYDPQAISVKKDSGKSAILQMVELCNDRPYVFIQQDNVIWKLNKIGIDESNTQLMVGVGEMAVTPMAVFSDSTVIYTPLSERKPEKIYFELYVNVNGVTPIMDSTLIIKDENILGFRYYNLNEIANDPGIGWFFISLFMP
jgi:hypothetical protein